MNNMKEVKVKLWRRLAAALYDAILLLACYFVVAMVGVALNGGEAVNGLILFWVLLFITWCFFVKFWCYSGQTLGMQVWKVKVVNLDGDVLNWKQASIRIIVAMISWLVFGLGFIWSMFNKEGYAWHDLVSQSKLVFIDHKKNQQQNL